MLNDREALLLAVLKTHAPDAEWRDRVAADAHEMAALGVPAGDIEVALVNTLSDGLLHGNWPWVRAARQG